MDEIVSWDEMDNTKRAISDALAADDMVRLVKLLDGINGSYAVQYVLADLLRKGNKHTLYTVIENIVLGRERAKRAK